MHISRLKKLFFDLNKKIGFSFISNLSQCKNKHLALDYDSNIRIMFRHIYNRQQFDKFLELYLCKNMLKY